MRTPRLKLVDGKPRATDCRGRRRGCAGGVASSDGWAGFPEALPVLCASYAKHPNGHTWGSLFFVEPHARVLVGLGGFKGPPSSDAVVEIGYAIAPAFQGLGLATDAVAQNGSKRVRGCKHPSGRRAHTRTRQCVHARPRKVRLSESRRDQRR